MKGTVLQYDDSQGGAISGVDGNRYRFASAELARNERFGVPGTEVDFDVEGRRAFDLVLLKGAAKDRKRWIAVCLAAILGPFGADRFYLRRNDEGRAILGVFLVVLIANNLLFGPGQGTNLIWLCFLAFGWIRAGIYLTKSDQAFFEAYFSKRARGKTD